jgi:hypothetical protein
MPFDGTEEHLVPDIQSSHTRTSRQYSYLSDGDISPQGLSVHFMASCTTNEPEVNDNQQQLSPSSSQSVGYPESSQRTTSAFPSSAQYDPRNFDYFTPPRFLSSSVSRTSHRTSHIPPGLTFSHWTIQAAKVPPGRSKCHQTAHPWNTHILTTLTWRRVSSCPI